MLIPKFKIGQKVYAVRSTPCRREVNESCAICNSTGVVRLGAGHREYVCPECQGKHYDYKYYIAHREATIEKIEIQEHPPKYANGCKSEIRYVLKGIDIGTAWRENRLFATEEEANEFCEKFVPSGFYDTYTIKRMRERTRKIVVIVQDGLVQEVYAEDPSVDVEVLDLDDQYSDRGETELGSIRELVNDARCSMHRVW